MYNQIVADLGHKMVFLGGPRQVGKTTLAKSITGSTNHGYLNWDIPSNRKQILAREIPDEKLLIFDEIHKYRNWRNFIKGMFDEFHPEKKILVTGSARLDLYRFGGDSLQGRYYYLRLHPLSFKEIQGESKNDLMDLFELGGFPEPFLLGSKARARRWSEEYRTRLVKEDISALENLKDLGAMELLMIVLPERVGSPLSVNALREDLRLNHQTVSRWLDILERTYAIFRISPFGSPKLRAVKKEQKHYHFDWTLVDDPGARFENMVASHLLKWCHYIFETEGRKLDLCFFRDHDKREVDFVVVEKKQPILCVECKSQKENVSSALRYFKQKFPDIDAYQIHLKGSKENSVKDGVKLWQAEKFLLKLI